MREANKGVVRLELLEDVLTSFKMPQLMKRQRERGRERQRETQMHSHVTLFTFIYYFFICLFICSLCHGNDGVNIDKPKVNEP